jgi:hypothetical protein
MVPPNMNLMKWQTHPRAKAPPSTPRPSYRVHMFFLIYTLKGWNQVHMFINPISDSFWPLHSKCYSCKYESNEMTEPTKSQSTSTKPRPCYRVHNMFFLIHTPKGWIQVHIFTKPISVSFRPLHPIFYSSTKYESIKYPTQPRPVAPQPRPRPCDRVHMFFLIHATKGWMKFHIFIN